jgi:PucR family transcriptional regulator, purine catabolism regulatory protein
MRLTLARILEHPSLAPAEPVLRAGSTGLDRRVRWIHSSEVLDIAALLRGGELLLTGGEVLASASAAAQRRYVKELAERQVAAVAIETGGRLEAIPLAVLVEAEALGFPVVELRQVVPFVGVAEALNAELVNDSVVQLRFAGDLARALSGILSGGGGVQALLDELCLRAGTRVALFDRAGVLITQAPEITDPGGEPTMLGAITSRISVRGAHVATLAFYPGTEDDLDVLTVAGDRAGEAIGLAMLRGGPPSQRDFAASELARLASHAEEHRGRIDQLAELIGLDRTDAVVGIAVGGSVAGLHGLDGLLWRHGSVAIDTTSTAARVVLSIGDRRRAAEVRTMLLGELTAWAGDHPELVIAVGPVVPSLRALAASMAPAEACVQRRPARAVSVVVDVACTMAIDWLSSDGLRPRAQRFVQGQLAMLLTDRRSERDVMMATLEAYFDHGCNKTRTAEALHLQRQSLYGRLERAFGLLGGDPTGTDRAMALHLALKLRHGLRTDAG